MTINTIDPASPDPNDVAGQGDDQIRALKQAVVDTFPQAPAATPTDPWDIPLQVGPRAIAGLLTKAEQADLAALDVRVGANELALPALQAQITANDGDIAALTALAHTQISSVDLSWPVGAIFISADGESPDLKGIPGTWAPIGDGRFLLGDPLGPYGATGGNLNNEFTLAEENIPAHKHQHSTFREDSGNGNVPPEFFTDPSTTFSSHLAGRDASSGEMAVFNTDAGINLSEDPTPINFAPAFVTVRFFVRTA